MNRGRRKFVAAVVKKALPAPAPATGGAFELPDSMLDAWGKPMLEAMASDTTIRKRINAQFDRVFGRQLLARVAYLTIRDERPDIRPGSLADRIIRRNLGV